MAATPIGLCGEPPAMSSGSFGSGRDHEIKVPLAGLHHDGAGRVGLGHADQIAVGLSRRRRRHRDDNGRQQRGRQHFR